MLWQYQKIKYFLKKSIVKKGAQSRQTQTPQYKQFNAQCLGFTHNPLGLSQEAWVTSLDPPLATHRACLLGTSWLHLTVAGIPSDDHMV